MLAISVGQPSVQFSQTDKTRAYMAKANEFLGQDGGHSGLNTSYEELVPYQAALYWRFLYEQCGGMANGNEYPADGLKIIWRTLATLYAADIVDIHTSSGFVRTMPHLMNQVLAHPDASGCPFASYEDSLLHFARAIYALGVAGGRCVQPGLPAGCGFYDPSHLYVAPPVSPITYTGAALTYGGAGQVEPVGIGSSFGVDFVDVILDPATDGDSLRLEFFGTPGAAAVFNVQLWLLTDTDGDTQPQPFSGQLAPVELSPDNQQPDGRRVYVIPDINTSQYNRLGLIITRLDTDENADPVGEYSLLLMPATAP